MKNLVRIPSMQKNLLFDEIAAWLTLLFGNRHLHTLSAESRQTTENECHPLVRDSFFHVQMFSECYFAENEPLASFDIKIKEVCRGKVIVT